MRQSTSRSRAKRKLWSSCLSRKNSKGEEEKARSEQRLGEAELKTKSWLHKHSPDHVQPAALQDKLDQEQRDLDQHRGVAEHEAELRGEVKLVQLRAQQGFPLKQESPEGKGRKCVALFDTQIDSIKCLNLPQN